MNPLLVLMAEGMKGEALPYLLRSNWMITSLLFICIIVVSYIFSKGKKHLQKQFKGILFSRERASLFDDTTASDFRHTITLILHTCIMLGCCFYYYLLQRFPSLIQEYNHSLLLLFFFVAIIFYMSAKWAIYSFVNWIFFKKERNLSWINAYFDIVIWMGLILLPVILLVVYFNLSPQNAFTSIAIVLILSKILLFWKCFNNFFNKIHGFFHLILYFCALEILPDLIIWKGMIISCNNLILNI